ncbi:hypothetical protein ACWD6R_17490 [Streptomyces sp. NPDC005151]
MRAFTVWILHREHLIEKEHRLAADMYGPPATAMVSLPASADPVACLPTGEEDDWHYQPEAFHDEAGGVL